MCWEYNYFCAKYSKFLQCRRNQRKVKKAKCCLRVFRVAVALFVVMTPLDKLNQLHDIATYNV